MRKPQLIVCEDRYEYYIAWYDPDDEFSEEGAALGENRLVREPSKSAKDFHAAWELWIAEKVAKESGAALVNGRYVWESRRAAREVVAQIKTRWKLPPKQPLPDWAKRALNAGWKPPKGWKP